MNRQVCLHLLAIASFSVAACQGAKDTELDDQGVTHLTDPAEPGADAPAAEDRQDGSSPGTGSSGGSSSGSTSGGPGGGCKNKDGVDHDGDGLSFLDGDCNDCDPGVRPGKIDVPGNGIDEDCSGKADEDATCDASLGLASTDPLDGARALGVCRAVGASKPGWGVVSAKYVKPDGTPLTDPLGVGILDAFGPTKPSFGQRMLALSSGAARTPGQPGYAAPSGKDKAYTHGTPAGWPKPSPSCPGIAPSPNAHDGAALELTVRVPVDAHAMSFEHALFTADFPSDVCSKYNDQFVVIMSPPPPGALDGNIVFDGLGGPIGASSPFLQVCAPGTYDGLTFACGQGTAALQGTGFEGRGATGWLRTTVPVEPSSTITLLFAVWDSGDGTYDTTVLLDSLRFWTQPVAKVQTVPK